MMCLNAKMILTFPKAGCSIQVNEDINKPLNMQLLENKQNILYRNIVQTELWNSLWAPHLFRGFIYLEYF